MTTIAKKLTIPTAAIKAAAKAKQAARPVKPQRVTLLTPARLAVAAGKLPPLLTYTSAANLGYNRHTETMYKLAKKGDLKGLTEHRVGGCNSYSVATREYQELLIKGVKLVKAKAKAKAK